MRRFLEDLEDLDELENEISDVPDSDVEDHEEFWAEHSDTVEEFEAEEILDQNHEFFIGKDKKTKWRKTAPQRNIQTRSENIVFQSPGVKNIAQSAEKALEIWKLFFSDLVIDIIIKNTNKYVQSITKNYSRERDAKPTDKTEIQALLGLLLFAGVRRNGRLHVKDLFRTDGSSPEIFRLAMNWTRFSFLLKCLCFDDKETRPQRRNFDKLAPIRELFDEVNSAYPKYYSPSAFVTIDEKLEAFRGRCAFRQYIPSKPNKYGLKVNALTDAENFYTLTMEVYVGKQPEGPYHLDTKPLALVDRMCNVISKTGRNVTTDNWFTSIELAKLLLHKHNLTTVGTIRKNKAAIPPNFLQDKTRAVGPSLFGFENECTLVSYVPKKGKNVLLISTMHDNANIDPKTNKPNIIITYNSTKGGVDTVDKLCATYNCARGTNRWPMVILYSLMNVSGINAFIIYTENNSNSKMVRKKFLETLSFDLLEEQLKRRATCPNLPKLMRERLIFVVTMNKKVLQARIEYQVVGHTVRGKNRKTRYNCSNCQKYFCFEHANMICQDCYISVFENN